MLVIKTSAIGERRFRASIYVDLFVRETGNLEKDREAARIKVDEMAHNIPNSYVGNVAWYDPSKLIMDREI